MMPEEGSTPKISCPRTTVPTVTSTRPALRATPGLRGVKPYVWQGLRSSSCTIRVPDHIVKEGKVKAAPVHNVKAYGDMNV